MKAVVLLIFVIFSQDMLFSQESDLKKYAVTITKEELSVHVYQLASDEFKGRYTGSEGQKLAAEYIRDEFIKDGLKDPDFSSSQSYLQEFELIRCYWEEQHLSSAGMEFEAGKDFVFLSDPENIEGNYPVIFAGFGIEDSLYSDYDSLDVTGKVVLVFSGEPKGRNGNYVISGQSEPSRKAYYFSKAITATKKGAKGLIVMAQDEKDFHEYLKNTGDFRARADITYPSDEEEPAIFSIYTNLGTGSSITNTSPENLKDALSRMEKDLRTSAGLYAGKVDVQSLSRCSVMNTENVIGTVEGTDLKDEAIVVVAHYDHLGIRDGEIYYGADDNASGTAALMELAEAFAKAVQDGQLPRRTVIFMAVSAEETGLHGSRFYSENPLMPMEKTYACINIDMIGRASTKLKDSPEYVSGYAYLSEDILKISQQNNSLFAPELVDRMEYRARVRGGSDHYYFSSNGVPSLFYFAGIHKDYHESSDTPEKILYDRMEKIVRAIFGTTWELANREVELKIKN